MDEKTKKRAVKHILYEMGMLHSTYQHLKNLSPATEDEILEKNAITESFLIHAYNLFRFYYQGKNEWRKNKQTGILVKHPRKDTDIIAEDYITDKKGYKQNRTPKRYLKNLPKKRNKQIAHLTYDRIKMGKWDQKIFKKLEKTQNAFFAALPPEKKKWFIDEQNKARQQRTTAIR